MHVGGQAIKHSVQSLMNFLGFDELIVVEDECNRPTELGNIIDQQRQNAIDGQRLRGLNRSEGIITNSLIYGH
jgi:hypothetical protein